MEIHDIKSHITQVLKQGYLMSLATVDEAGVWVADVIYIFDDDLTLYWMSDPEVRHSQALLKNAQVAAAITVNQPGEPNLGIQVSGMTEKITGPRYDLAVKHYAKRRKATPAESDDVLQGDSWYLLKPQKIDLIHEALFGFDKVSINL